jgi:amidophosphoribosyltransferase
MSDFIKHECGIALVRLLQPLSYYREKYGSELYGLQKLFLLLEKQHNRGQDGAGIASIKLNPEPGTEYIDRWRSIAPNAIDDIMQSVYNRVESALRETADSPPSDIPFLSQLYLGHLRYGTFGGNTLETCHPVLRQNNWMTRNLVLAGNFNLTNVDELFNHLLELGQVPREKSDTVTVMENIGHFLDEENETLYHQFKAKGYSKAAITPLIAEHLDIAGILRRSSRHWDGGYVIAGLFGHGDAFVLRDAHGIRPAFFYSDDEVVVVTSERPAIQTAFNVPFERVEEIKPGHALIIKKTGQIFHSQILDPAPRLSCSFERIYFSRGSDKEIYRERKELGRYLCPAVLSAIDYDLKNTVFSFIPNTAEVAFYGMMEAVEAHLKEQKRIKIKSHAGQMNDEWLNRILSIKPRFEKIAIKDVKLRTFITNDHDRSDLVTHVYDITYGTLIPGQDNLVVIDDSIVRGTTLKNSIIRMLARLQPRMIVIVSSAPQIRYPDCYGIDMAKIGDLIAFRAAIRLLEKNHMEHLLDEVYERCLDELSAKRTPATNHVRMIYQPFTAEEISQQIAEMVTPPDCQIPVKIIFQKIEDLHRACPNHRGDWYFTGNYPTAGGNRVACRAFVHFMQGINERAY